MGKNPVLNVFKRLRKKWKMILSKPLKYWASLGTFQRWMRSTILFGPYYWVKYKIRQISRLYGWYKNVLRDDYDFDYHSMFGIIEYKLKRIQNRLLNGNAIHEDRDLKALKLAIKLAGRLKEDKYEDVAFKSHEDKWGEYRSWTIPTADPEYVNCHIVRTKVLTPEDKIQETDETLQRYDLAMRRKKREERWMYDILHKYLRSWWD